MLDIDVGYKTGSGNIMSVHIVGMKVHRNDIPYMDMQVAKNLCGTCKGFNGGCPTYSPSFPKIKPSLPYFYVISAYMDMAWATLYAGGKLRGKHSTRSAQIVLNLYRIVYIDRLSERYIRRIMNTFERMIVGYGLAVGNCIGCPGKCTVMDTGKCAKPDKRRYSMEATGVECSELHKSIYGERLPWWYSTPELPTYMCRYSGVFVKDWEDKLLDDILAEACYYDKSFISMEYVPPKPVFNTKYIDVPNTAYDAGSKYKVYEVFHD